jgi:protein-S-isoprenylcysteine O-methyltransferase Ste14
VLLLKNLAYSLIVPSSLAIYVPWLLIPDQPANSGIWLYLSLFLFFLGGAVYSWCLWDFAIVGHGTPAPFDAPKHLVVQGPYHYTRNPMYGGVLTMIFGWIVLFPSLPLLLYGLSVGFSCHLLVLLYEEPHLQNVFRANYGEYCTQVQRWVPIIRVTEKTSKMLIGKSTAPRRDKKLLSKN